MISAYYKVIVSGGNCSSMVGYVKFSVCKTLGSATGTTTRKVWEGGRKERMEGGDIRNEKSISCCSI